MKFLIDENMPLSFAEILNGMGYDAVHVFEVGLDETDDAIILEHAKQNQQIIITFDLDFSRLVAVGKVQLPSVITFRTDAMTSDFFKQVMTQHLNNLNEALTGGALVTITDQNIRVKRLPVG
jgi:predicted nuclease of predicted toxin-antitoxin system